jgi:hypothetical protein
MHRGTKAAVAAYRSGIETGGSLSKRKMFSKTSLLCSGSQRLTKP